MAQTKIERLLDLAALKQTLRPQDLERAGIPRNYLGKLVRRGKLQKLARGLYTTNAIVATENISLLEVSHRLSKGVICLLSALRFHDIGSESPSEVWIALPQRFRWNPKVGGAGHHPRVSYPSVRIVRFSEEALQFGVQEHRIGERTIRVFSPAKTIADCFKFRNKIGTNVAIEALRDCYRQKKASMGELWSAAEVCRVTNVMRPYLESLN
jgi:predicted transcriptional regulator of viral defense system